METRNQGEAAPRLVAESSVKSHGMAKRRKDTFAFHVRIPSIFNYHARRRRHAKCVTASYEDCVSCAPRDRTRCEKGMKSPLSESITMTISYLRQQFWHCHCLQNRLLYIYIKYKIRYKLKICCAKWRSFIEDSMNFKRNIVNPSARWTEKISRSTGRISLRLPNHVYISLPLLLIFMLVARTRARNSDIDVGFSQLPSFLAMSLRRLKATET